VSEPAHLKRVIVNADDLGFSEAVTEGIIHAHREGIVTSTTLAANMPAAAAAIERLAHAPEMGVGIHLNISQGPPLSEAGRRLAGRDGLMARTATGVIRLVAVRPWLLAAVTAEFDAQIRWVLDRGIRPTHLDSHRHCHAWPPIFRRVIGLARRYDIPFVRRHRERLPGGGWPEAPAKQRRTRRILNTLGSLQPLWGGRRLATTGTWGLAHTGLLDAAWLMRAAERAPAGVTEIMTHPGRAEATAGAETRLAASRPRELAALCDPAVWRAFDDAGIELIHYGHLHRTERV